MTRKPLPLDAGAELAAYLLAAIERRETASSQAPAATLAAAG